MDALTPSKCQFPLTFSVGKPVVLADTVSTYWVFYGKVKLDRMGY
jgi:hypothetical protein